MTFTQNENLPLVFLIGDLALCACALHNKVPMCHIETLHRRYVPMSSTIMFLHMCHTETLHRRSGDLLGAFFTVRLNHTA